MVGIRLSSHEKLCAERMKTLIDAIKDLRKDVNDLKNEDKSYENESLVIDDTNECEGCQ
jgi:FtsZ-binding cell division protein ZapB